MRGLTANEEGILEIISDPSAIDGLAIQESSLPNWRPLVSSGRVILRVPRECACGHCYVPEITPAGRQALRLHRQLITLGAL